jgi:aspartyl-tRNA(Asn)/glutamyl-tRNA(Gln) amidotransferase subunit C
MLKPEAPTISAEEAQKIARLAHLRLEAEELEHLTRDLGAILGYVRQLDEIEGLAEVPPTAHVQLDRQQLREDDAGTSLPRELALREAPRVAMDGFAVPAFVDEG